MQTNEKGASMKTSTLFHFAGYIHVECLHNIAPTETVVLEELDT